MNEDIIKKSKDLLESTKSTSLSERINSLKTKIAVMSHNKNTCLLCDTSGSMNSFVVNSEDNISKRAIDVLDNVLKNFVGANIYSFNTTCKKVDSLPAPGGGTDLAGAFCTIKSDSIKELILLTDGQPDDEHAALKAAQKLKINIIYIGPAPTPQFLIKLAKITGGKFDSVELLLQGKNADSVLENKIRGFLNA